MNKVFFLLLLLVSNYGINAQQARLYTCLWDSLQYGRVDSLVTEMVIPDYKMYTFDGNRLKQFLYRDDTLCSIKNYALVFDHILAMGLDYTKPLPKRPARNNVMTLDTVMNKAFADEYIRLDAYPRTMKYLFFLFVDIKKEYEYKYAAIKDSKYLKKEIDNLINYGTWTHSEELRQILLLRRKHISREKYYDDLRKEEKARRKKRQQQNEGED